MCSVLNTLSEYTYFYISKNITSYTFLLVSKIVESLQCILTALFVAGKFWTFIRINQTFPTSLFFESEELSYFKFQTVSDTSFLVTELVSIYLLLPLVKYPEDTCWDVFRNAFLDNSVCQVIFGFTLV